MVGTVIPELEVIGPYRVVAVLGQGGMGTVYKGLYAKTEEPVAIKVIASAIAQQPRFRRRFDAEIRTLLRLKHPNIVQLIGVGEEKGHLFYSMEYVDGENLHQLLRRQKRFSWQQVVAWAIEIAAALKHAHDFGIIHRDLKPANLMITRDGHVKLTDFGIAKLFGASEQTVPGSVLGTADFMAPEQAEGKPVTVRSDLYALGAICYAALTGRPPFTGTNVPEILFNVRYGSILPLNELAPETPRDFCDLIDELLRRDPSQRPPTALVVGKRLQSLNIGLARHPELSHKTAIEKTSSDPSGEISELTSLDMSDHPSIVDLAEPAKPDGTRLVGPRPSNVADGWVTPSESVPNVLPTRSVPMHPHAGPEEITRAREEALSESEEPSATANWMSVAPPGQSSFRHVTDEDRKRSSLVISDESPHDGRNQILGIATVAALLVICLAAAYWFSRPPSADSLYAPVAAAIASEDEEQMQTAEDSARRFVDWYPDDPRAAETRQLLEELEIQRTVRQLQRRADEVDAAQLGAVEQAFLECARLATTDPPAAQRKLKAMMDVFPDRENLTRREQRLMRAADRLLARLDSAALEPPRHMAREALEERMRWAQANLSRSQRNAWLQSLIELYGDQAWAAGLISEARSQLQSPTPPQSSSEPESDPVDMPRR
jgi:serine/threonine-protein kinase